MLTIENVKKIKWYRQSGAGIPFLIGMPFWAIAERMEQSSGLIFPNDLAIFGTQTNDTIMWYHYWDLEKSRFELDKIFAEVKKDGGQKFYDLENKFLASNTKMVQLGNKLLDFSPNDVRFATKVTEFLDSVLDFWGFSLFSDLIDPFENEVIEFIFGSNHNLPIEQLNILMSPDEMSCLQMEQAEFLNILNVYQADGDQEVIDKLLNRHVEKYNCLKNDYLKVEYLDHDYFATRLAKLAQKPSEIQGIRVSLQKNRELIGQKNQLISELKFDESTLIKLKFFNWIINNRDERKRVNLISHYYLMKILEKISKTFSQDLELIKYLLPWELNDFMVDPQKYINELGVRQKSGLVIFATREKIDHLSGDISSQYLDIMETCVQTSEIKGSIAARGKVIARAKIILSPNDFGKMQKGNILVTSMTRPEFLPVMKLASAIITDEGGITCHAAIIARELGIPCITGTQVATKVLHDGDLVEVDADKGVTKIIKN